MTTVTADAPRTTGGYPAMMLPRAVSVLAVTTGPGKESPELGGLLYAFRRAGAGLSLLSLSRGEGAQENACSARLEAIRPWELQLAATVLGISDVMVASYPDGALHRQPEAELADRIGRAIRQHSVDLVYRRARGRRPGRRGRRTRRQRLPRPGPACRSLRGPRRMPSAPG